MGVTDYMSIANYSKLRAYKAEGRVKNIDLLIPNIEFRIAPPTDKATAINIHLLVCPDDEGHEQQILDALARLDWEYKQRRYSCLPNQLIALGHAFDPSIENDRTALATGTLQFKVDFTTFRDWFQREKWIEANSLIAVSANDDGLSGFRNDGAWGGFREEITRFSQLLFSGRAGEREFWLARGSQDDRQTVKKLGGPKPVIHGSDAHSIANLFRPVQDRFCWLKADCSFDGLRQIIFEPDDRVYLGPTPPHYHDEARVIRSIKIGGSNGWFENTEIPLNSGLVSIIGQKGTGKSALAELIAYSSGSWDGTDKTSFLHRAGEHIEGLEIELTWADGKKTDAHLWQDTVGTSQIRYLSQRFVERLCAEDHIGSELVDEIEAVIFSYIDPTDTLNASNFKELRQLSTEGIRAEGDDLRVEIKRLIHKERELRASIFGVASKRTLIQTLTTERTGLISQMPTPATEAEAKLQTETQQRRTELSDVQQLVGAEKQKLQKIADIRSRLSTFKTQIVRFNAEMDVLLRDAGVVESKAFRPQLPIEADAVLTQRTIEIQRTIGEKEGALENPTSGTIRWLVARINKLLEQDTADKARQQKIKNIQNRVSAIDTQVKRLEEEITQAEGPDRETLNNSREQRSKAYIAYFENLKKEQEALELLYDPIKKKLGDGTAAPQEQELEFSIRWAVDLNGWLERGGVLFDQRKTIPYGTMLGLSDAAKRILLPAWVSGDAKKIGAAMIGFLEEFRKSEFKPSDYLRSGVNAHELLEWIYEVDQIQLTYGLKYNGVELEKLSPGTKGIVLLILYLGMDVGDSRPLVVDQPDENLDNESIYALLTTYFKAAKLRRQIVLITHNPNLVVNADSEQVIIATSRRRDNGLPQIVYHSGSLENSLPDGRGIRQQVCRILEGGAEAFLKREKRYAL